MLIFTTDLRKDFYSTNNCLLWDIYKLIILINKFILTTFDVNLKYFIFYVLSDITFNMYKALVYFYYFLF